ncbi:hypothetical protein TrispH2_004895 [Trichoplax sp. H2]|nr:hypothetical protein TrispH2_004895 [Trichoplax sp. H2]|eukprot:RDD42939.1 hypothetical protein TrispH2_004895 [Trichoplax sp. H2]
MSCPTSRHRQMLVDSNSSIAKISHRPKINSHIYLQGANIHLHFHHGFNDDCYGSEDDDYQVNRWNEIGQNLQQLADQFDLQTRKNSSSCWSKRIVRMVLLLGITLIIFVLAWIYAFH